MRAVSLRIPAAPPVVIAGPERFDILRTLDERGGLKGYEPESFACALACMQAKRGTFYDIGANVGVFSVVVAGALGRPCIAFEPTPDLADVVERASRTNGLQIEVRRIAVSDAPGTVNFFLSPKSDASNSLNPAFRPGGASISVTADTLDGQITAAPALLKIDVETAEPEVMRGAAETIRTFRPYMIVEVLRPSIAKQINDILADDGYVFYRLTAKGLEKRRRDLPVAEVSGKDRNWLMAPRAVGPIFRWRMHRWIRKIRRA